MPKLPRYTLDHNEKRGGWNLENQAGRTVKYFETKADATAGGVLKKALGPDGGSVRIQKENGRFQEERTFPPSRDPKKSPG